MSKLMDRQTLANKVEWEGGILATLDYGITPEEIADPELRAAWTEVFDAYHALTPLMSRVRQLLKEPKS